VAVLVPVVTIPTKVAVVATVVIVLVMMVEGTVTVSVAVVEGVVVVAVADAVSVLVSGRHRRISLHSAPLLHGQNPSSFVHR
jgi:hypothetical protein